MLESAVCKLRRELPLLYESGSTPLADRAMEREAGATPETVRDRAEGVSLSHASSRQVIDMCASTYSFAATGQEALESRDAFAAIPLGLENVTSEPAITQLHPAAGFGSEVDRKSVV